MGRKPKPAEASAGQNFDPAEMLSIASMCKLFHCRREVISQAMASGELPHLKSGRVRRASRRDFETWCESQKVQKSPPQPIRLMYHPALKQIAFLPKIDLNKMKILKLDND